MFTLMATLVHIPSLSILFLEFHRVKPCSSSWQQPKQHPSQPKDCRGPCQTIFATWGGQFLRICRTFSRVSFDYIYSTMRRARFFAARNKTQGQDSSDYLWYCAPIKNHLRWIDCPNCPSIPQSQEHRFSNIGGSTQAHHLLGIREERRSHKRQQKKRGWTFVAPDRTVLQCATVTPWAEKRTDRLRCLGRLPFESYE